MFLALLTVADRLHWLIISYGIISQGFLVVTAYNLVHVLHSPVGHLDLSSGDDWSKNVILGEIIYDLKEFFSNVSFNIQGKRRVKPDSLSSSRPVLFLEVGRPWVAETSICSCSRHQR